MTMTAAMINIYEAIKALQAGKLEEANEYVKTVLAPDDSDMRSRVLAAAILMIESEEDVATLKAMAIYNDMEVFVAQHEEQITAASPTRLPETSSAVEDVSDEMLEGVKEGISNMLIALDAKMTKKQKKLIADMGCDLIERYDSPYTRAVVASAFDKVSNNMAVRQGFARYAREMNCSNSKEIYALAKTLSTMVVEGKAEEATKIVRSAPYSGWRSQKEIETFVVNFFGVLNSNKIRFLTSDEYRYYGERLIG